MIRNAKEQIIRVALIEIDKHKHKEIVKMSTVFQASIREIVRTQYKNMYRMTSLSPDFSGYGHLSS